MRGYFLFVIIVNHLDRWPSALMFVTGRGQLWASAAEGFMFMSGLLVGRLRGPQLAAGGGGAVTRKVLGRAAKLALWSAGLTLAMTLLARATGHVPEFTLGISDEPLPQLLWRTFTFRYTYGLHDMLLLYAIFLAATPLAIRAMARGWTSLVVVGSFAIWAVGLLWPTRIQWTGSSFSEPCWQLLFFLGMAVGFHWPALLGRWARLSPQTRRLLAWTFGAAAIGLFALNLWLLARPLPEQSPPVVLPLVEEITTRRVFAKLRLGPGRVAVSLLWMVCLYGLCKRYEDQVLRTVGRFLVPLGQHSLYVYIIHAIILFPLVPPAPLPPGWVSSTLLGAGVLGLHWLMVRRRVLFQVIPR